ncbi:MAG: haloacid dehalogenase type II [Hyphomicrobiales bacterium]
MTAPRVITFDCYGTLVQWREGLHATLGEILAGKDPAADVDDFVDAFHEARHEETERPYRPYKEILTLALGRALDSLGRTATADDAARLLEGVRRIGPFPEVPAALRALRENARIAIISNSDRDLMVRNVENIGVPVDHVFVAEDAGAYKPSLAFFRHVIAGIGCDPAEVLHVGASMSLDMAPTRDLGIRRVWIDRLGQRGDPACEPYERLPDLTDLPDLVARMRGA